MKQIKILIDLRFFHPGASGGIENYAYFALDSIKNLDIEIYIEIPYESLGFYKKRFDFLTDDKIIIDPLQKFISQIICFLTFGKKKGICIRRQIKNYGKHFDFVFYPFHMMNPVHTTIKIITAFHAFLPETYNEEIKFANTLVPASTALITSWNYPYQEFLKLFPAKRYDWFLIPFVSAHNLNGKIEHVDGIETNNFLLYVSFFSERKNHIRLVEGYKKAFETDRNIPSLVLVGGGYNNVKKIVRERIVELSLQDKIRMYDYLPDSRINYLYKNCKGVIAPTLWEAASGAVLEGVHSGKPVLCSNVAPLVDFAEYFKLKMLFFDPLNIKDIAEKIIEFSNNYDLYNIHSLSNAEKLKHIGHKDYAEKFYSILKKYLK